MRNPRFIDCSEAGTGKTYSAALYSQWVHQTYEAPVIWVQPKSLIRKNKEELIRFTDLKPNSIVIVEGNKDKRYDCYKKGAAVYLMTADTIRIDAVHVNNLGAYLVIVDEVHLLYGQPNSKRCQALFMLMQRVQRFLAMTGTIISGKYITLYPTLHIVEPRYYLNLDHFKTQHCRTDFFGSVIGYKNGERLREILSKHSVRTSFEQAYGKEAKVIIREYVDLTERQKSIYEKLEREALIELEDDFIAADKPGPKAIRARQILSCPEVFDPKCPSGRDETVSIHFEEPGQLVVFSHFVAEQERTLKLAMSLGRKAALMNGSTSGNDRTKISEAYIRGELDTLIVSPSVGGVGFNWGGTNKMLFLSMSYQDSDFIQNYRRAIRGKREKPLLIYLITYDCKVERRVFDIIERKSREANVVDPSREVFDFSKL
ncbi:MAG: DEAD/DEAH box helicase [Rhodospirillaceae bacterium]